MVLFNLEKNIVPREYQDSFLVAEIAFYFRNLTIIKRQTSQSEVFFPSLESNIYFLVGNQNGFF